MKYLVLFAIFVAILAIPSALFAAPQDATEKSAPSLLSHSNAPGAPNTSEPSAEPRPATELYVDGAILYPVRSAIVSSEVSGVLEKFHAEEGDRVSKGQVIAEISRRRFVVNVERALMRVKSLELAVKTAQKNCDLKRKILSEGAGTEQELLNADAALEAREAELAEARHLLKLAHIDLDGCKIKAPFDGFIEQIFKSCFETVEKSEKLFEIVDASSVYAVANAPADKRELFDKGRRLLFVDPSGNTFAGVVHKHGMKIDPKSNTRKVYVLIPNDKSLLQIGLSGQLRLAK